MYALQSAVNRGFTALCREVIAYQQNSLNSSNFLVGEVFKPLYWY